MITLARESLAAVDRGSSASAWVARPAHAPITVAWLMHTACEVTEVLMDMAARAIVMDTLEIRRRNWRAYSLHPNIQHHNLIGANQLQLHRNINTHTEFRIQSSRFFL